MNDFFRFPHTPHLAWLAGGTPRDDKLLSPKEVAELLSGPVVLEEKLDGANLGLSISLDGAVRVQNRGQYLNRPFIGQFSRLAKWLSEKEGALPGILGKNLILFGEWCAAKHSLDYDHLPDWFLVFDIYDREAAQFWSTSRRDKLAERLGMPSVPALARGRFTVSELKEMVGAQRSRYRNGAPEGLIVRRESPDWMQQRAKIVRPGFTQAIAEHWSRRPVTWNRVSTVSEDAPS